MERKKIYKVVALTAVLVVAAGLFLFGPGWSEERALLAPKERIVFASSSLGRRWDIYTIAVDGSELVKLTSGRNQKDNQAPGFSPDGKKIVFYSNRSGNWDIYVMNADGSDQGQLTDNPAADAFGSFSPDGSRIVFHSNRSGNFDIYVMNADGSEPRRLTDNPAADLQASWSPDGKKIVFVSNRENDRYRIYVMNSDGSDQRQLTNLSDSAHDMVPKFSPDGTKIVFEATDTKTNFGQIRIMNADGSRVTALTRSVGNPGCGWTETSNHRPQFSPDGKQIVFISFSSTTWCGPQVFIMDTDGSNQRQITDIQGPASEQTTKGNYTPKVDYPSFSPVPIPAPAK